jgi:hypothetical protein
VALLAIGKIYLFPLVSFANQRVNEAGWIPRHSEVAKKDANRKIESLLLHAITQPTGDGNSLDHYL